VEDWNAKMLVASVQRLLDHEKIASTKRKEDEVFDTKYSDSKNGRRGAELLLDFVRFLMHKAIPWSSERSLNAYEALCIINSTINLSSRSQDTEHSRAPMYAQVPEFGSMVDIVCETPMVLLQLT
jgi:hypothetical protein